MSLLSIFQGFHFGETPRLKSGVVDENWACPPSLKAKSWLEIYRTTHIEGYFIIYSPWIGRDYSGLQKGLVYGDFSGLQRVIQNYTDGHILIYKSTMGYIGDM